MSAAPPRVSVCIPAYNGADYIDDAIRSVLTQEGVDLELVVVDDASRDATADIARIFTAADPRVRVEINASNLGQRANWDRAIAAARGASSTGRGGR